MACANNKPPPVLPYRRRVDAIAELVEKAVGCDAKITAGGQRIGERGFFFAPTVARCAENCRAMTEEPFGPLALLTPFESAAEAIERSNANTVGPAGYVFTHDMRHAAVLREQLDCGTLAFNHLTASWPETPFGRVKAAASTAKAALKDCRLFSR
jgi:succinate-semialdehyde dehydrogenase/glutarate-semialdehyde dehydrogenase